MKKVSLILALLLVMFFCSQSFAGTIRAEASPLLAPDTIQAYVPFMVNIYMFNDGLNFGYSWPMYFYSPDQSITVAHHQNVGGYSVITADIPPYFYNDSSIIVLNDFDTLWTFFNSWFGWSWDDTLNDTINHTAVSETGWPASTAEELNMQFAFIIEEAGTFCVDSCSIPDVSPAGKFDWLFDPPMTFNGPYCWTVVCVNDEDCDGIVDSLDNCPAVFNPDQENSDGDNYGDSCDICPNDSDNDIDGDGHCADADNCPATYNPNQENDDGDSFGNVCDNCPDSTNEDQADSDGDGNGDVCDICPGYDDNLDTDEDGWPDACDNCPNFYNPDQSLDADGDGVGDPCDNCIDAANPDQEDTDADLVGDSCDVCPGFNDGDDSDSDNVPDSCDNCPDYINPQQEDTDADAVGDSCDNCIDAYNPDQLDTDGDNIGDVCDWICGDANGDLAVNIFDITFIISYLYTSGPPPAYMQSGDVNNDCTVNIYDVTDLIQNIYGDGAVPNCPLVWPCKK